MIHFALSGEVIEKSRASNGLGYIVHGVEVFLNTQAAPPLSMTIGGLRSIGVDGRAIGIYSRALLTPRRSRSPTVISMTDWKEAF